MKNYAEEKSLLSQPQKMLVYSFKLQNGTFFYSSAVILSRNRSVLRKKRCFVEYTRRKSFNSFVQSAVDARSQDDENPNSSIVAETMERLANSSYAYQIIDRSRHIVMKYFSDKKTHAANNSKLFKKHDHVNISLREVELAKAETEHKKPIIVGFLNLK